MTEPGDVILRTEALTKTYPGTTALDHVDFQVRRGRVNVLIGENGAGKSTLVKIIAGVEQPTSGRLLLDGRELRLRSTRDADAHSIAMIHQELNLCRNLTVAENIFLARETTTRGIINRREQERSARELLGRLDQSIDPAATVGHLRLGEQQIVEIAKALARDVRILIMDEPTSALSATEVQALFRVIGELSARGVTIIYISHKLEELLRIGDYITVLRDGRLVAEAPATEVNVEWIVEKMVGGRLDSVFRSHGHEAGAGLLAVENLTLPRSSGGHLLEGVSFVLRKGEILGIYGLMGAGRTELFESLLGLHPDATGAILLEGEPLHPLSLRERLRRGLALVPEDRQGAGIVQTLTVRDNMILASLASYTTGFWLDSAKVNPKVDGLVTDLSIKVATPAQPVTSLSGGNQQKVVFAKCLLTGPKVLLLDEPTRGIDVGAKGEVCEIMNSLAARGMGVIFASSELEELLGLADRILVMARGRITAEFTRAEATDAALASAAGGGVHA